jgi:hypothetical protein
MLMAAKVPSCAALALDAVNSQGMCVVIGLQSTGEANTAAVSTSSIAASALVSLSCTLPAASPPHILSFILPKQ